MVTKDIKVSYGKRFDTGGCAYDQMLSIRLKSAEILKLEASIKETRQNVVLSGTITYIMKKIVPDKLSFCYFCRNYYKQNVNQESYCI